MLDRLAQDNLILLEMSMCRLCTNLFFHAHFIEENLASQCVFICLENQLENSANTFYNGNPYDLVTKPNYCPFFIQTEAVPAVTQLRLIRFPMFPIPSQRCALTIKVSSLTESISKIQYIFYSNRSPYFYPNFNIFHHHFTLL